MSAAVRDSIPAPVAVVFAHLTEPDLLTRWWPSGAETDPVPGGSYHIWWEEQGWHLRGDYLEVDPPDRLSFTWKWDHDETPPRRVDIALLPVPGTATRIEIDHHAESEEEATGYREGWEHFLGRLKSLLEAGN